MKTKNIRNLEDIVKTIPGLQPEGLLEVIKGMYQGKPLLGEGGLLTNLVKNLTEISLQCEMEEHLNSNSLEQGNNRRNGVNSKNVQCASGAFELNVPRDRNSTFEPQLVKKRQTILNDELDNKILALYSLGTSYSDIASHLQEIYGVEVSPALISSVTDKLVPQIAEWRSRGLERIYPIVFLDAMYFKVKQDNKVSTKVVYNVLGINQEGKKEILGFYTCESEGSHFWLGVLNDLKTRGVEDILIACVDGLQGFPEAINAAFPRSEVQLRV